MTTQTGDFAKMQRLSVPDFMQFIRQAKAPKTARPRPRPSTPLPSPGAPTAERRAKEPDGFDEKTMRNGTVYVAPEVLHKIRTPIEIFAKCLSAGELAVAEAFVADAEAASVVHVTMNYSGDPRVAGSRNGGVGDAKRSRYLRFIAVLEMLPEEMRGILALLLLGVRNEATGKPYTAQAIGQLMTGVKCDNQARGVGLGYMKASLAALLQAYRKYETAQRR